jgi:flagellar biosynthesis protein FliR
MRHQAVLRIEMGPPAPTVKVAHFLALWPVSRAAIPNVDRTGLALYLSGAIFAGIPAFSGFLLAFQAVVAIRRRFTREPTPRH